LGSAEYEHDLFSDSDCLSVTTDILFLQLINPDRHTVMEIGELSSPVHVTLPMKEITNQKYHYQVG